MSFEQFRIPYHNIFKKFLIFECSVNKLNCNAKHTQYYDYCNSNVENFNNLIQEEMNDNMINDFGTILNQRRLVGAGWQLCRVSNRRTEGLGIGGRPLPKLSMAIRL